jgi:hypothetical protein
LQDARSAFAISGNKQLKNAGPHPKHELSALENCKTVLRFGGRLL